MNIHQNLEVYFLGKCNTFSILRIAEKVKRFNTSQCGNFFTYKIAPIWNRLPAGAVNSASVEQFKIELDKVIDTLI